MSIDLKVMRPGKLAGLLNSTRLGEVTSETRVRRNIVRAGLRVGDSTRVNVLGYAAWLVAAWHARRGPGAAGELAGYDALRASSAARNRRLSATGRDIAPLPDVANPERRAACEKDFRRFCDTYFPTAFTLPWSGDHLKVITKIEAVVLRGGQFAQAMPRGSGKTTLAEIACVWAILYAHRHFVCLIGATADRARAMLESIKTEFECNEALLEDFPASIYAIRRLERIHNRASGQTLDGEPTRILWTVDKVVMPTVAGSAASGAILVVTGLEGGNIRGQKHKLADGHIVRPDLAITDDPQTTESAWSESQSARREALLAGDVLGMAGPGKKIAAIDHSEHTLARERLVIADAHRAVAMSPSTVSELNQKIYATIEAWRNRRIEGEHPYVFLNGLWLKRSWGGEVQNVAILVAIGVDHERYREVLGVAEGAKEDKASWQAFLRYLKGRGLKGVRLVTSDKCLGLVESLGEFYPEAKWQRCVVHFYRNVLTAVPKGKAREVAAMLKAIHAQEDRDAASEKARAVAAKLEKMKLRKASEIVREGYAETLSYCGFPSEHWRQIRTNNPLERLMREIRRRTRVVGAFPDGRSALMLAAARLRYIAGSRWGTKRYLNAGRLTDAAREEALAG